MGVTCSGPSIVDLVAKLGYFEFSTIDYGLFTSSSLGYQQVETMY